MTPSSTRGWGPVRYAPRTTSVKEYLDYVSERGLKLSNNPQSRHSRAKAIHYVAKVGIQRFHTYYFDIEKLIQQNPQSAIGVDDVLRLYKFDRKLRLLTLDAIERIEVAVKVYFALHLMQHYGDYFLYKIIQKNDLSVFNVGMNGSENSSSELRKSFKQIQSHIRNSPENNIPKDISHAQLAKEIDIRLFTDTLTLGKLSRLYKNLNENGRRRIAKRFSCSASDLESWLFRLTHVRNFSAHHSRLWNRNHDHPVSVSSIVVGQSAHWRKNPRSLTHYYSTAVILFYLLQRVARRTRWHWRLHSILDSKSLTPECMELGHEMGFPKDWDRLEFWKGSANGNL